MRVYVCGGGVCVCVCVMGGSIACMKATDVLTALNYRADYSSRMAHWTVPLAHIHGFKVCMHKLYYTQLHTESY